MNWGGGGVRTLILLDDQLRFFVSPILANERLQAMLVNDMTTPKAM